MVVSKRPCTWATDAEYRAAREVAAAAAAAEAAALRAEAEAAV